MSKYYRYFADVFHSFAALPAVAVQWAARHGDAATDRKSSAKEHHPTDAEQLDSTQLRFASSCDSELLQPPACGFKTSMSNHAFDMSRDCSGKNCVNNLKSDGLLIREKNAFVCLTYNKFTVSAPHLNHDLWFVAVTSHVRSYHLANQVPDHSSFYVCFRCFYILQLIS